MSAREQLAAVERRGRGIRALAERVRERGGVAVVEEAIDLPRLRAEWRRLRDAGLVVARLDALGPTPVDAARVDALRALVARRSRRGRR